VYCLIASLKSFMVGYKLPGSITGLFLSNIFLSPRKCWKIGMAAPSSQLFSAVDELATTPFPIFSYFSFSSSFFKPKTACTWSSLANSSFPSSSSFSTI
jgi:hypothetical protein